MLCRDRRVLRTLLLLILSAGTVRGDPTASRSLSGIWAHSENDCQIKLSGQLDNPDLSRPDQTPLGLIGFCKDGMDLLYQPVHCDAHDVRAQDGGFAWSGACHVKDYDPKPLRLFIKSDAPNAISFRDRDFEGSDFAIEGSYVRCSLTYKCVN